MKPVLPSGLDTNAGTIGAGEDTFTGIAAPWTMATLTIQADAAATPGTYTLSIINGAITDDGFGDSIVNAGSTLSVTITPEPISAMLLLAGVPLIRRRRG